MRAISQWLLVLTTACSFGLMGTAYGEGERTFPTANFQVTMPAGWEDVTSKVDVKNVVVAYRDPAQTRMVTILSVESPETTTELNAAAVEDLERDMAAGGSKRISGKFVSFLGIKCYERIGSTQGGLSTVIRAVPTYGRVYYIQCLRSSGGPAAEDHDFRQIIESFRFLKTPRLLR